MSQISEACGGGDAGRALVPGVLRGYRTWRLRRSRASADAESLPLTSVTRRHIVWPPVLRARCEPGDVGFPAPWAPPIAGDHPAPQTGCNCGIYAWYSPADTGMISARVFGAVEASGLVLMGERGFRAEQARITAVVTRNRRLAAACERAGVAVYRRRRDLLRDHPPEDLSSLLGGGAEPEGATDPGGSGPHRPPATGFDGLVFLAVWGRAALIAAALVVLPTAPALVTAVVAQCALIGFITTRLRR
ncbi:MAG: hypothetical protein ACLFXM_02905 [Acidimicrobiia bacterium]